MVRIKQLLTQLGEQIDRLGYLLITKMGEHKLAMAGVFAVNYILYELVKYWS
jgi:hypothetical protein